MIRLTALRCVDGFVTISGTGLTSLEGCEGLVHAALEDDCWQNLQIVCP